MLDLVLVGILLVAVYGPFVVVGLRVIYNLCIN